MDAVDPPSHPADPGSSGFTQVGEPVTPFTARLASHDSGLLPYFDTHRLGITLADLEKAQKGHSRYGVMWDPVMESVRGLSDVWLAKLFGASACRYQKSSDVVVADLMRGDEEGIKTVGEQVPHIDRTTEIPVVFFTPHLAYLAIGPLPSEDDLLHLDILLVIFVMTQLHLAIYDRVGRTRYGGITGARDVIKFTEGLIGEDVSLWTYRAKPDERPRLFLGGRLRDADGRPGWLRTLRPSVLQALAFKVRGRHPVIVDKFFNVPNTYTLDYLDHRGAAPPPRPPPPPPTAPAPVSKKVKAPACSEARSTRSGIKKWFGKTFRDDCDEDEARKLLTKNPETTGEKSDKTDDKGGERETGEEEKTDTA